ncbi:MAG: hypothetical protein LYZ70_00135 [Nitrososphaerales archaeon]|nr:hypothetical protein [Nitrososphaerales archaeon]
MSLAPSEGVSIVELKRAAGTLLPSSSALRELILSEPDFLPSDEVSVRIRMYSRLLYGELKRSAA